MNTNRSLASLFFLGLTFPPDLLLSGLNPNLREPTSSALLLNRIPSEMEVALRDSLLPLFRLFQLHYTADTLAGMQIVTRLDCCWMQALRASDQKTGWSVWVMAWIEWMDTPWTVMTTGAPVVLKRLVIFITFRPSQPRN